MLLKSIRITDAVAVTNFIGECADDFFHLKSEQPALAYATRLGLIRVYACVGSDYLVRYFRSIYEQDPARFFRLSREYSRAQKRHGGDSSGWAVTRFAGQLFLSLRWANEFSVYKVPLHLREPMIARGLTQRCYLDCSFVANGLAVADHHMSQQLAVELAL